MNYLDYITDNSNSTSLPSNVREIKATYYLGESKETTPMYSSGWFDWLVNYFKGNETNSIKDNKNNSFNALFKRVGDRVDKIILPTSKPGNLRPYGKPTAFWNLYNGPKQGT